jgi:hypothetical protein
LSSASNDLLLLLILDPGAQFIQIGDGAGLVLGHCLVEEHLVGFEQRFGVGDLALVGDHDQIGVRHLLNHFAASGHFAEVRRLFTGAHRFVAVDVGAGKEGLIEVDLAGGDIGPGDEGNVGEIHAGKTCRDFAKERRAESEGGEVEFVVAVAAGDGDGRQKVLQRREFLASQRLFVLLRLFEAEIGGKAALHRRRQARA